MDARGGSAGPSALSQADLLRHSTLHAYALSRTAALHAGLSHNASLAHLAAAHAQDALAALLHCAATQRALDGGAPEGGGRVGPPAVRPRVGWVGGGETAGPGAGSSSTLRDAAAATGTTASDWRAAAQLAVPSYMALHNPACSSCGLPSIPGLTSTSAFPRTEEHAPKKRRKSSKTDAVKRVAADMLSARCLLCNGAVIPGHAASDPVLERAEREAAQRSKARFPSVKKRKALERQHASHATESKMSKVPAMQAVKRDVFEAAPGRSEPGHGSPLLLSKKAKTKSKSDASAGLPSLRAMMPPLSKASTPAQPAMGLLSFPGLSSPAKPQPDKAPTPRTPAVAFGPSLTSSFSPSSISSKSSMGKRPDPISNPNLPGPASRSAALGLPPSASKKASISASTTTRPSPLSQLGPSSSSSTGSSAKERKKERAAALRGLLGAKAGQPGKGAEKEKKGGGGAGGGGLADFLSML
ncbi:hypothetical protein OC834_003770 [Tilletia horrida]|nr:hypothetical protein OC834_003770 [Tilletia horrida]